MSQSPCPTVQGFELEQQLQSVKVSQEGGGGAVMQQSKEPGAPDGQSVLVL